MSPHDPNLRARLRAGDPAVADAELESAALARLARRVEAIRPRPAAATARPALLVLAAASAVVAVAVALLTRAPAAAPREPAAASPAAPVAGGSPADDAPRQLQFETPGGTRVVWVLDPNLVL